MPQGTKEEYWKSRWITDNLKWPKLEAPAHPRTWRGARRPTGQVWVLHIVVPGALIFYWTAKDLNAYHSPSPLLLPTAVPSAQKSSSMDHALHTTHIERGPFSSHRESGLLLMLSFIPSRQKPVACNKRASRHLLSNKSSLSLLCRIKTLPSNHLSGKRKRLPH